MDFTMLRQMTRRTRVDAILQDDNNMQKLSSILDYSSEPTATNRIPLVPLTPVEAADALKKGTLLSDTYYDALLKYLHLTGRAHYRAYNNFPHPPNATNVLPPQALHPLQIHCGECTFSCQKSHAGNSAIQFYNPLTKQHDTGFIQTIWKLPLDSLMQVFIVVQPHKLLPASEEKKSPYFHYPGFQTRIVDAEPSNNLVIIEPGHIITHLSTFHRPVNTYGIGRTTLVVCWALNRGRK